MSDYLDAIENPLSEHAVQYGNDVKMELLLSGSSSATTSMLTANEQSASAGLVADSSDEFLVGVDWSLEEDELASRILAKLTELVGKL